MLSSKNRCYKCEYYYLSQLALVTFSQFSAAVERYKANDGVVYAIWVWFKYDTALSGVV